LSTLCLPYALPRTSVQGTGLGQPSTYVKELLTEWDVSTVSRMGSARALRPFLSSSCTSGWG